MFISCLTLSAGMLYSQSSSDCCGKTIRQHQEISPSVLLGSCAGDTLKVIDCLLNQISDSIGYDEFLSLIHSVRNLSSGTSTRTIQAKTANLLFIASGSNDKQVVSLSLKMLREYPSSVFNKNDLEKLGAILKGSPQVYKESVLLAGYAGYDSIARILKEYSVSGSLTRSELWTTRLALARLGDKESLNYCIDRVKGEPVNENTIEILFPDLIYTRQKEAINVLINVLNSDEKLCRSANPEAEVKILCGYRIMEMLAPVIRDFPVRVLPSGDLDIRNYKSALADVRKWFTRQNGNYVILNDTY